MESTDFCRAFLFFICGKLFFATNKMFIRFAEIKLTI